MRGGLIAVLLMALSAPCTWLGEAAAGAQTRARARSNAELPAPSIGLPLPSIGLPLPSIGLPLPPMGLGPPTRPPSILDGFRGDRVPPRGGTRGDSPRGNRRGSRASSALVFIPAYGYGWPYVPDTLLPGTPVPTPPSPPPVESPATGRLHIALQSGGDPQLYVDGYYVGLWSDLGGDLTLVAGAHTLELREEGYETLHVDVNISAGASITYRGAMKRLVAAAVAPVAQAAPAAAVPPPAPTTIYMIPGCYVGNIPPHDASLPAGCDEDRAIAFPSRP